MKENREIEEIKKLIKNGFDLELISFELDIPMEKLMQYKMELETERKLDEVRTYSAKEVIESKNRDAHLRIEKMRERYKKLFFCSNESETKQPKELPKQDIELINLVIVEIEEMIKRMKDFSKGERRKGASVILTKLKKIDDLQLTIEQAEKLYSLMQSEALERINLSPTDKINYYINKNRIAILKKLAEAIDIAQNQTEELEKLKNLREKLTLEMQQDSKLIVGTMWYKIENKMSKISQRQAVNRVINHVPSNIDSITKELASGTLNIQNADEILEEEAKKRVESKPRTRFTLTEEQEKRQILMQIEKLLMERPEQYHIENPEKTIMQIQALCGAELSQAVRTVIKNLTNIKDFERAKEVCDEFAKNNKEGLFSEDVRRLRKEIKNNEIGDIVLKMIHMKGTEEEERRYFELIEKGLKVGNVKLRSVSLGKSQDGLRDITLADIWGEDNQKEKLR